MGIAYTTWELETRDAAAGLLARDHGRVWAGPAASVELSGRPGSADLVFTLEADGAAQFRFALHDASDPDRCQLWTPDEFAIVAIANAHESRGGGSVRAPSVPNDHA
jgi:hypothetical protein